MVPKKLIEVLNNIFQTSHGSFQITLIVSNDKNLMDDKIKSSTIKLFNQFTSFAMAREFRNNIYVTYTDAKYAYDAYAQLNNYYLQNYDITLQVRVENEQNYQKLIEQELMDCLISLNCVSDNLKRGVSVDSNEPEVNVAELVFYFFLFIIIFILCFQLNSLLGDDFKYGEENESFKSYINLPSQIRHNRLSITNDMDKMNAKNSNTSTGHDYHNPLVKALSNSNLNMFNSFTNSNQLQLSKQATNVHSVVDLLGLSNNEDSLQHPPPRRPPPPVPTQKPAATTFKDIFGQDDMIATSSELSTPSQDQEETLVQISDIPPQPAPLIFVESSGSLNTNSNSNAFFGFEDDFSSFNPTVAETNIKISSSTQQAPPPLPPPPTSLPSMPTRPPPLPQQQTASFSLFDDPFDTPAVQSTVPLQNRPPPPPLPPMPPNLSQKMNSNSSSYMNDLESLDLRNNNSTASMNPPPLPPLPSMPTRPQPPPLPPLPPSIKPNVITNNNKNNPLDDLNPFGDSFNPIPQQQQQRQPPLPPPRPNHFK